MLKKRLSYFKEIFNNKTEGKERKKTIENLIVLGIILIISVIFINYMWSGNKKEKKETSTNNIGIQENLKQEIINPDTGIENKLENILSKINGVGEVKVMITYSQSSTTIPLYNEDTQATTTEEKDTSGGIRKITENSNNREVVYDEINGSKSVITQSIISPKIEGAIVIAKGVSNATVKNNIIQAVEAVTSLPTHKIQVFEMK